MAYTNNMTRLLDIVEMDLGTDAYNLPDKWSKDVWADKVIDLKTLYTFSRYFPNKVTIQLDTRQMKLDPVDDYYIIDESIISPDIQILGIKDIPWSDPNALGNGTVYMNGIGPYGILDSYPSGLDYEDYIDIQTMADNSSLMSRGIYPEFKYPNKIKLTSALSVSGPNMGIDVFKIDILVKHHKNLTTISPTKMEIFERLATADVAKYLYNKLKYYDGIETVFANVDMHMQELQEEAQKRDEIITELKEGYVSAANDNQPIVYSLN